MKTIHLNGAWDTQARSLNWSFNSDDIQRRISENKNNGYAVIKFKDDKSEITKTYHVRCVKGLFVVKRAGIRKFLPISHHLSKRIEDKLNVTVSRSDIEKNSLKNEIKAVTGIDVSGIEDHRFNHGLKIFQYCKNFKDFLGLFDCAGTEKVFMLLLLEDMDLYVRKVFSGTDDSEGAMFFTKNYMTMERMISEMIFERGGWKFNNTHSEIEYGLLDFMHRHVSVAIRSLHVDPEKYYKTAELKNMAINDIQDCVVATMKKTDEALEKTISPLLKWTGDYLLKMKNSEYKELVNSPAFNRLFKIDNGNLMINVTNISDFKFLLESAIHASSDSSVEGIFLSKLRENILKCDEVRPLLEKSYNCIDYLSTIKLAKKNITESFGFEKNIVAIQNITFEGLKKMAMGLVDGKDADNLSPWRNEILSHLADIRKFAESDYACSKGYYIDFICKIREKIMAAKSLLTRDNANTSSVGKLIHKIQQQVMVDGKSITYDFLHKCLDDLLSTLPETHDFEWEVIDDSVAQLGASFGLGGDLPGNAEGISGDFHQ